MSILLLYFRETSLALATQDCPRASDSGLKSMGKSNTSKTWIFRQRTDNRTRAKQKTVYIFYVTYYMILGTWRPNGNNKIELWPQLITMTAHGRRGVSNQWQLDCLFKGCLGWHQRTPWVAITMWSDQYCGKCYHEMTSSCRTKNSNYDPKSTRLPSGSDLAISLQIGPSILSAHTWESEYTDGVWVIMYTALRASKGF